MVLVAVAMTADLDLRFQRGDRRGPAVLPRRSQRGAGAQRRGLRPPGLGSRRSTHGDGGRGGAGRGGRLAAGLRRRAGLRRHRGVVQHRRAPAVDLQAHRRGPGGADRLLDLHLHQLHPHAAVRRVLGRRLPQGRPDRDRRALAGVRVREGRRQRRATPSTATGSTTRWSRTTTSAPGTRSATSTGRRST